MFVLRSCKGSCQLSVIIREYLIYYAYRRIKRSWDAQTQEHRAHRVLGKHGIKFNSNERK